MLAHPSLLRFSFQCPRCTYIPNVAQATALHLAVTDGKADMVRCTRFRNGKLKLHEVDVNLI